MKKVSRLFVAFIVALLAGAALFVSNPALAGVSKTKTPDCESSKSDADQYGVTDGWGWENGQSCRVRLKKAKGPISKGTVGGLNFGEPANDPLAVPDVLEFDEVDGPDPWDEIEIPVPDNVIQGPWGVNPRPAEPEPPAPQHEQGGEGSEGQGCGGCGAEGLGDGGQNVGDADAFGDD